jgi:preprotein translocase subunit SecG
LTVLLVILHVLVCLFLIFVVLLQRGKGAEMGAAFGGSSQTLFGSRGASTFLSKLTTVSAVLFMITSLSLTMVTTKTTSVIRDVVPDEQRKAVPQGSQPLTTQPPQQAVPQQTAPQQAPAQTPQQTPAQPPVQPPQK